MVLILRFIKVCETRLSFPRIFVFENDLPVSEFYFYGRDGGFKSIPFFDELDGVFDIFRIAFNRKSEPKGFFLFLAVSDDVPKNAQGVGLRIEIYLLALQIICQRLETRQHGRLARAVFAHQKRQGADVELLAFGKTAHLFHCKLGDFHGVLGDSGQWSVPPCPTPSVRGKTGEVRQPRHRLSGQQGGGSGQ